ncbi:MAG TPA: ribosome assembly RNA-binding protein YhbY [Usitatibacter sp.]|nr:ribosome assembly RNA-binding protein YhbY [Usitatibacter sp.]
MASLTSSRRSELRAEAHTLHPVVLIGDKGLTDEVLAEIDRALKAHELVKVRAATDDRDARNVWMESICEKLQAHPVQQIGKVFVIYREKPDEAPASAARPPERKLAQRSEAAGDAAHRRQQRRDEIKRKARDVADMVRKGKIAPKAKAGPRTRDPEDGAQGEVKRTSRPRSRTPSPRPASEPRRRRPRTSR